MENYIISVKSIQLEKKLLRIYAALYDERIALTGETVNNMNSIERWNDNNSIRSRAISLARVMKTYIDKPLVSMERLVKKYGLENAVQIAETMLNNLHSVRVECKHTWNKLIASAMDNKVSFIKRLKVTVVKTIQRALNHFRSPRTHRSRRFRFAVASADSGGDAGPDADGPDASGLTGSLLASGWSR